MLTLRKQLNNNRIIIIIINLTVIVFSEESKAPQTHPVCNKQNWAFNSRPQLLLKADDKFWRELFGLINSDGNNINNHQYLTSGWL